MTDLGDTMKKVILAGIGAAAQTTEKAQALLNDMVKKGELTVEQGKVLNQELRHDLGEKRKENRADTESGADKKETVSKLLQDLSVEDLKALKAKLDALDLDKVRDDTINDESVD